MQTRKEISTHDLLKLNEINKLPDVKYPNEKSLTFIEQGILNKVLNSLNYQDLDIEINDLIKFEIIANKIYQQAIILLSQENQQVDNELIKYVHSIGGDESVENLSTIDLKTNFMLKQKEVKLLKIKYHNVFMKLNLEIEALNNINKLYQQNNYELDILKLRKETLINDRNSKRKQYENESQDLEKKLDELKLIYGQETKFRLFQYKAKAKYKQEQLEIKQKMIEIKNQLREINNQLNSQVNSTNYQQELAKISDVIKQKEFIVKSTKNKLIFANQKLDHQIKQDLEIINVRKFKQQLSQINIDCYANEIKDFTYLTYLPKFRGVREELFYLAIALIKRIKFEYK